MGVIPMERVLDRLDRLTAANDAVGARRHLLYWLEEARMEKDERAQLTICNELMGQRRMAGDGAEAVQYAEEALALTEKLALADTVTAATVYVNCGTVYTAFGRTEDAIPLFERAQLIYLKTFDDADPRVGSLYNNMATCLVRAKQYERAEKTYRKACETMRQIPGSEPEIAITMLNLADLYREAYGIADAYERIDDCVQKAHDLLETGGLTRDANYAQVCGKCAPIFEYYGWFAYAKELRRRAESFYETNGRGE